MSSISCKPPELCAKTKAILTGIDRPDEIHPATITDIVGVFANIKPASVIDNGAIPDKELGSLGLPFIPFNLGYGRDGFVLSKDPEIAAAMVASLQKSSHIKNATGQTDTALERKIGMMLGYPKTATDYYLSNAHEGIAKNRARYEDKIDLDTLAFCNLVLSRRHWREEIVAYVTPFAEAVKQLTPVTHRTMLANAAAARSIRSLAITNAF